MRSIVEEALSRSHPTEQKKAQPTPLSADDEELEKLLQGLKTNIKIFGCGGAGSNTINRMVEIGVMGAEFYAVNTDAQHLLTVHSPHKI
ncbi:MAG TPA: cell division protein FtsZ, partial [Euryarchaeota archaeon]|nr:cell division protein FtsZ [Euryarchaeota archaeon]